MSDSFKQKLIAVKQSHLLPDFMRSRYGTVVKNKKALCLFHSEKSASMVVDDLHFHCFGCGASGDIFDLLMKLEKLTLKEALAKLSGDIQPSHVRTPLPQAPKVVKTLQVDFCAIWKAWDANTKYDQHRAQAAILGVEAMALKWLGFVWAPAHKDPVTGKPVSDSWAVPSKDPSGKIIGLQLRTVDGPKFMVTGSKVGLFTPSEISGRRLFVCEGASDTAAALSMFFPAIGRFNCLGCEEMVNEYIAKHKFKEVVIVADNDSDKKRPDGTSWNPGYDGARKLQASLKVPSVTWIPDADDLREFLQFGGDDKLVRASIADLVWKNPK